MRDHRSTIFCHWASMRRTRSLVIGTRSELALIKFKIACACACLRLCLLALACACDRLFALACACDSSKKIPGIRSLKNSRNSAAVFKGSSKGPRFELSQGQIKALNIHLQRIANIFKLRLNK